MVNKDPALKTAREAAVEVLRRARAPLKSAEITVACWRGRVYGWRERRPRQRSRRCSRSRTRSPTGCS